MSNILLIIGLAVVLIVLIFGIVNLGITSDKARSRSNKLMRLRVIAQFIVVILLMVLFYIKSKAN